MSGHGLDVGQQPDGRVLVGMEQEGAVVQALAEQRDRVREVEVVLAQDRAGLRAVVGFRVLQVEEAVRLDLDDRLERVGARHDVVGRPVVGRERVRVGPHPLDHGVVGLGRIALRAAEHHVLEEVRVAGESRLHLVARSGAHHRVVRHDARAVVLDAEHPQPVVQLEGGHRERKDVVRLLPAARAERGDERHPRDTPAHDLPSSRRPCIRRRPPRTAPARRRPARRTAPRVAWTGHGRPGNATLDLSTIAVLPASAGKRRPREAGTTHATGHRGDPKELIMYRLTLPAVVMLAMTTWAAPELAAGEPQRARARGGGDGGGRVASAPRSTPRVARAPARRAPAARPGRPTPSRPAARAVPQRAPAARAGRPAPARPGVRAVPRRAPAATAGGRVPPRTAGVRPRAGRGPESPRPGMVDGRAPGRPAGRVRTGAGRRAPDDIGVFGRAVPRRAVPRPARPRVAAPGRGGLEPRVGRDGYRAGRYRQAQPRHRFGDRPFYHRHVHRPRFFYPPGVRVVLLLPGLRVRPALRLSVLLGPALGRIPVLALQTTRRTIWTTRIPTPAICA